LYCTPVGREETASTRRLTTIDDLFALVGQRVARLRTHTHVTETFRPLAISTWRRRDERPNLTTKTYGGHLGLRGFPYADASGGTWSPISAAAEG